MSSPGRVKEKCDPLFRMYTCARNSSCEINIKQNGEENLLILEKSNETLTKKEEIVLEEDEVQTHEVFFKINKS